MGGDSITNGCGGSGGGATVSVASPVSVTVYTGNVTGGGSLIGNIMYVNTIESITLSSNLLANFNFANALYFSGDGSNIFNINASSISLGTLSNAVFPVTGVVAGIYGDSANIPQLVIDQYGVVSNAVNVQTQWTPTYLFNIATANGVSIGTLNDPPTGSNLYVLGTANVDTMNVVNLFANTVTIYGLNTLNVYGTSNMNSVYASNLYGNATGLYDINGSSVTGNVASSNLALIVTGAAQPNITSVGVLTSLQVQGQVTISNGSAISNINSSNLVGNVANANVALVVSGAAQPNITSVGTLTGLTVNGLLIASNGSGISNINSSNLIGNVANANVALVVSGAAQPNITSVGTLTGLTVNGLLIASNGLLIASNGSGISNINSSNLVGNVANANVALVVSGAAQPNITSVGTLTGLAVSGQISGDGYNITNLNPGNISGTVRTAESVINADQPNITSVGTLTTLYISGLLGAANGSGISNINSSNISGTVATAGVVTGTAQPNITSVGTLTGLNVNGLLIASNGSGISNINSSNLVGNVAAANVALVVSGAAQPNITSVGTLTTLYVNGLLGTSDGSGIANLRAANVVGTVATAGVVTEASQPNITSVGTLTSLDIQGILNAGLYIGNAFGLSNINASNVIGDVPLADSVLNPDQPNITSVGTLSNLVVSNSVTTGNVWANSISVTALSGKVPAEFYSDSGSFYMTSTGRIGINTTSPSSQLEVAASGTASVAINLSDGSTGPGNAVSLTKDASQNMILMNQSLADSWLGTYTTTRIRMYSSGTQALLSPMYIGPSITTSPSSSTTLYVLGNAYISNSLSTTNVYANQGYFGGLSLSSAIVAPGFSGGAFTGGTFQGTTISGTTVTASTGFTGTAFTGQTFSGVSFVAGTNITSPGFSGSAYTGGTFAATTGFTGAAFSGGTFQGSTVSGTTITASTGFTGAAFTGGTFQGTTITASTGFTGAAFTGGTFQGTTITASTGFTGAAFTGGTFQGTTITASTGFTGAAFTGGTFQGSTITASTGFTGAAFTGGSFYGTNNSNLSSANVLTANILTANIQTQNIASLNVYTGANITTLTVSTISNAVSANIITANVLSSNIQTENVAFLNVFLGANVTTLTGTLANIATLNTASANVTTENVASLNVFTGANISTLTVSTFANILSANIVTINSASGNITSENVSYLNVISSLVVSGVSNLQTLNATTVTMLQANIYGGLGANLAQFNFLRVGTSNAANIYAQNLYASNIYSYNVAAFASNLQYLSVASNIIPANGSGNTYLTGNIIVSGNVYSGIGSPLGAGGGYYLSLPSDIATQIPYTGPIYGTTYPLSVGLSNGFTINGTSTLISVTANGNFKFTNAGVYKISAVFTGSDNITGLALGSNAADVHGTDQGYMYRYTTQITQNPTELIEIPFDVTDVSKYYYLDLFMTAGGILRGTSNSLGGTYLTITPLQGGGLASGGPGGTPGTQWINSGSDIYFSGNVGIGPINPRYNLDIIGNVYANSFISSIITGKTTSYTLKIDDYYIGLTSGRNVTLPLGTSCPVGKTFIIKDEASDAALNNIIISAAGGDLIDGNSSITLALNNISVTLLWTGTRWSLI